MNENDDYIKKIVAQHTPNNMNSVQSRVFGLKPHIHAWANGHAYTSKLSGSLAKETGITGTTDIDIFVSLSPSVGTCNTLENVYNTLRNRLHGAGYTVREQNVSLGIDYAGLKVDIVAGVKHHILGLDHSIWKRKAQTWTKTNIDEHINYVKKSGRAFDIKAIKIWRKLRELDFPSFYLELSVIEALRGRGLLGISPAENFVTVLKYLAEDFVDTVVVDPANQNNEVSEESTEDEKQMIRDTAVTTLKGTWNQAIW